MSAADFIRASRLLGKVVDQSARYTAMKRVTVAGSGIMKHETPAKRGGLRRSITDYAEPSGEHGTVGTNLPYARPVNDGSRPHIITAKKAKALKTPNGFFKSVRHPGTKANPFVGRTRERLRPVAERELAVVFGVRLGKVR